jgi:hypothetical protein
MLVVLFCSYVVHSDIGSKGCCCCAHVRNDKLATPCWFLPNVKRCESCFRQRWVAISCSGCFNLGIEPQYLLERRLDGPSSQSWHSKEENNILFMPGTETEVLGHPVWSLPLNLLGYPRIWEVNINVWYSQCTVFCESLCHHRQLGGGGVLAGVCILIIFYLHLHLK